MSFVYIILLPVKVHMKLQNVYDSVQFIKSQFRKLQLKTSIHGDGKWIFCGFLLQDFSKEM